MKITFNWLQKHIKFQDLSAKNIFNLLNSIENALFKFGAELDDIKFINPIICGKILEIKQEPKISICKVEIDKKIAKILKYENNILQIITTLPNIKVNMITKLAPIGTFAEGVLIEKRIVYKYLSEGMFLGVENIENSNEFIPVSTFDDIILDLKIPANRWDMNNARGIARELSFANLGEFLPLITKTTKEDLKFNKKITNNTNIPFSFAEVNNIKINEQILVFMQNIGKKSANNLQTFLDFILIDIGHPIAIYDTNFDLSNLKIEKAKNKQEILLKNNKNFICTGEEILIKNNEDILSLAGIISFVGYNANTENILIECGFLNPENITKVINDSSKMFDLGIDQDQATLIYILSLIDGKKSNIYYTEGQFTEQKEIFLPHSEIIKFTNISITMDEIIEKLTKCGFSCKLMIKKRDNNINDEMGLIIKSPNWRRDIINYMDLVEEIYLKANHQVKENTTILPINLKFHELFERIRLLLIDNGLTEVYSLPFTKTKTSIKIINSINEEYCYMRNNLFDNLQEKAIESLNNGEWGVKIFEIAKIYPEEKYVLGIIFTGKTLREFKQKSIEYSFSDLKKTIMNLSTIIDLNCLENINLPSFLEKGICFREGFCGKTIDGMYFFQCDLIPNNLQKILPVIKYNYIDLSIDLSKNITWHKIRSILDQFTDIKFYLFDLYEKSDTLLNFNISLSIPDFISTSDLIGQIRLKLSTLI